MPLYLFKLNLESKETKHFKHLGEKSTEKSIY